ncbi:MAG: adenosylcobinamide-GDP ribazoletransferase [Desulfobacteraceae bacterium 4572_35.1]|nr:MAG: adenosylcobinamide-GDP ribazoletransferase [Desulfobacteraceae bacterium 4572_35.1]
MNLKPFFSALRFLTIVPIPESWCGDEDDFYRSPDWYPLVGLCLGLFLVLLDMVLRWLLPLSVVNVLLLVAMIAVSGALHLDGLADSADAFFSSRGREQMLEIMKDSRSGPMGVTAIVLVLLLKLMLLIALPSAWRWQVLLLMPLCGRCSLALVSSWLPYSRHSGTAKFSEKQKNSFRLPISLAVMLFVAFILMGWSAGVVVFGFVVVSIWLLGRYSRRKIGGFTGDTLGATCELVEMVPLLAVVVLVHMGWM